jgi:hypothetical protein
MSDLSHSYAVLATGALSGWLGALLFLALGALATWQLRRELHRWTAPVRLVCACRWLIIGLAIWLLCRPLLVVTTQWTVQPRAVVLTVDSASMAVSDRHDAAHQKLDLLTAIGTPTPSRNAMSGMLATDLRRTIAAWQPQLAALEQALDELASGLPARPAFNAALDTLAASLNATATAATAAARRCPEAGDEAYTDMRTAATGELSVIASMCRGVAGEIDVVRGQAAAYPELLRELLARFGNLQTRLAAAAAQCSALQDAADVLLVPADVLAEAQQQRLSRRAVAARVGALLEQQLADGFVSSAQAHADIGSALAALVAEHLQQPVAAAILIGDGSMPLDARGTDAARTVAELGVPVHTVLCGTPDQAPADVGLIAVDVPRIAVAGQPLTARALVKASVEDGEAAVLTVRAGKDVLATANAAAGDRQVVSLEMVLPAPGRRQLVFAAESDSGDAYPGNEVHVVTVDVLPAPARVVVLSDRLTADAVAWCQAAGSLAAAQPELHVVDPDLRRLKTGSDVGELPGTADGWATVDLLIAVGRVPRGLEPSAADALAEAAGRLAMIVQPGADPSWARLAGIDAQPIAEPLLLRPEPTVWLPFYQLAASTAESAARWLAMPPVAAWQPDPAGIPLVAGAATAPVQVLHHQGRLLVFCGVRPLSGLRAGANADTANHLMRGLITEALRPAAHRDVFPAQPVAGRRLWPVAPARLPAGLGAAGENGDVLVGSVETVAVRQGGGAVAVHRLPVAADFLLTARETPLRTISDETSGTFVDAARTKVLAAALQAEREARVKSATVPLWTGWWSLLLIVVLGAAEYLLRRRCGRVM